MAEIQVPEGVEGWEDMGRKAEWFLGSGATADAATIEEMTRLRSAALEHAEGLRRRVREPHDPGGAVPRGVASLVGAGRGGRATETDLPGDEPASSFLTAAVRVSLPADAADAVVKIVPRSGTDLDPATARLARFDDETGQWQLVPGSAWSDRGYLHGAVDEDGIYAAVALPKDPAALEKVALAGFAARAVGRAAAEGIFTRPDDLRDKRLFASWFENTPSAVAGMTNLRAAERARARAVRVLGRRLEVPTRPSPQWSLIDLILTSSIDSFVDHAGLIGSIGTWWPLIDQVNDVVGPWFPFGPGSINGRVKSLAGHPTNGNIIYAGAANGGVWKTTDGGATWRTSWVFEESLAIGAVAVAPSAPNVVYAATGEDTPSYGPAYGGAGVYRSTDSGTTWTQRAPAASVGMACSRLVVDPSNHNRLFVASTTGVHRSTDGGATWTTVLGGHATDIVIAHDHPNRLVAGIWNDKVYRSSDGGTTWTPVGGDLVTIAIIVNFSEPFPTGNDLGWVRLAIGREGPAGSNLIVAKFGPDSARTAVSEDGGENWLALAGSEGVSYDEWTSFVAVHPRDHRRMFIGGLHLQRSINGFSFSPTSGTHSDHHQMVFHPTDDAVAFVATDGGVYRTTDGGGTWQLRAGATQAAQLMSIGVGEQNGTMVGCATQDQGIVAADAAFHWRDTHGGNEWGMFVVDPNDNDRCFINPGSGQLRRSTDGAQTWSNPSNGLTEWWAAMNRATVAARFREVAVRPGNSNVVIGAATVTEKAKNSAGTELTYGPRHGLFYSTDAGVNWSRSATLSQLPVRVTIAPSSTSRVYAVTENGEVWRHTGGGTSTSWSKPYTAPNAPPAQAATCLAVDPYDADVVYVGYANGANRLWRSFDGGATWAACVGAGTGALPVIPLRDLWIDPENRRCLWVATDIGVFRSNNRGASWYPANDGIGGHDLPRVPVSGFGYHPQTRRLFVSTVGRGCYITNPTGLVRLRAVARSMVFHGIRRPGIVRLRLVEGSRTYDFTRQEVIRRIQAGTEVFVRASNGRMAEVRVHQPDPVHPQEYVATVADDTEVNNLLSLPEYFS
ncbi:DUF3892 domain-containing protein [Actinotalea sp. M2MS4P-6]|uniref:DUF3892 domain-containing protein n=1 Tax=Actinotalea sp. M2MS4P-6 TaxID=2983762 RepID=UPI0021E5143D|nr:DUF3892 domain-containing protein [Actinotalea sp. M2MS4P-6]MCV2395662.1 DUF3892 domain-containing protein [Actinotalea sp. M2MS4P-6]